MASVPCPRKNGWAATPSCFAVSVDYVPVAAIRVAMRQVRLTAKITRRVAPKPPHIRLGRGLSLMQASGHPFDLPYEPVRTAVHDMTAAPGFRETLRVLERRQFEDGAAITVPVTVAFGSRDRVLLPGVARRRDQLPDQTLWITLSGCGTFRCSTTPWRLSTCCSSPPELGCCSACGDGLGDGYGVFADTGEE
jgi:pimeloyl-ACP methyl ester carboxylesterase